MSYEQKYCMTVAEVAKALQYTPDYVRQLAAKGDIPAAKRRRQWLFRPIDIQNFLVPNNAKNHNQSPEQSSEVCDLLR